MRSILVIGESCADIFVYGTCDRICPEAPVPVINPTNKTENGGMANNVVANLEALKAEVKCITNTNEVIKSRYVDNIYHYIINGSWLLYW